MGFAPPRDAPPPNDQAAVAADAGFEPSPTGSTLCGFPFPISFNYSLSFRLPALPFFPPSFDYFLAFSCDLSQPFTANAGFSQPGGGRKSLVDPDSDPEFGEGLDSN